MAVGGIQLGAELVGLKELQDAIGRVFQPAEKAKILKAALTKAIEPVFQRLKQTTPVGPTGNLRRAVSKKVIPYAKDGNAVAIVGFKRAGLEGSASAAGGTVRSGPDRAFHQWWLEEGTDQRVISKQSAPRSYNRPGYNKPGFERGTYRMTRNGKTFTVRGHSIGAHAVSAHTVNDPNSYFYASSFNRLGPFKILKFRRGEKGFITEPGYPNAFFRKSRNPIVIDPMPAGGVNRQPPLKTAWEATRTQVAETLQRELRLSLEQALSVIARSSSGTIG